MPRVPGRRLGRMIVATVQQACHLDMTAEGGFPAEGPGGGETPSKENA